jgi:rRNA maturation endonuclease Nob1
MNGTIIFLIFIAVLGPLALRNTIRKINRNGGSDRPFVPGRDCHACGGWGLTPQGLCSSCGGRKTR